jgi:glycosyltransferase involved in cell wall biosynthesis
MITICFTYFRSLTLANLAAALYSVRRQDLSQVKEIVLVDNNTDDAAESIHNVVDRLEFAVPVLVQSVKHGIPTRTHSWSTNLAIKQATASWVLMTRADYLLDFGLLEKFLAVRHAQPEEWNGFVTSKGRYLDDGAAGCERMNWRTYGPSILPGTVYDHTLIDAGVWMARRDVVSDVRLDERLTAWGHAQTDFQHRLYRSGVEFIRLEQALFHHMVHGGEKDIELAHAQLAGIGGDLKDMWTRNGWSPYQ